MSWSDKWALPLTLSLDRVFPVPHEAPMFRILFLTFSLPPSYFGILVVVITETKKPAASLSLGSGPLGAVIFIGWCLHGRPSPTKMETHGYAAHHHRFAVSSLGIGYLRQSVHLTHLPQKTGSLKSTPTLWYMSI
jgi:hypothetical protein